MGKTAVFMITGFLVIAVLLAGCNPSTGTISNESVASKVMRAISQVVETTNDNTVASAAEGTGTVFRINGFTADDGQTTIADGTVTVDADGMIANVTLTLSDGTTFTLVPAENGAQSVTVNNDSVSASAIPEQMTREEKRAFHGLLMALDEALDDDIDDWIEDAIENQAAVKTEAGTYQIEDVPGIAGSYVLAPEADDDDDEIELEITSVNVEFSREGISGSYSFAENGNTKTARVNLAIVGFAESDDDVLITISDAKIDAEITEGEVRDNDTFYFKGSLSGAVSVNGGESHDISFSGEIDAMEDVYFRFPDYSLRINGIEAAIGRQEKPVSAV